MKYGSFLRRLGAYIIDSLIFVPIMAVVGKNSEMVTVIVWTGYFVWMTGMYGATIGKMVLGLKVTKEDGSKVNYSDALLREIASYLSAVVLFLGYLTIIGDKRKQGWHDKIAHTVVVRV